MNIAAAPLHYLVLTALGPTRLGNLSLISRACTQCGCNLMNAKTNTLGQEMAMVLWVSGNWGSIAKIEALLPKLERDLGARITAKRTIDSQSQAKAMGYTLQISAIDKVGIVHGISDFLYQMDIPIEEMSGTTYLNPAGTRMAVLTIKVHIPEKTHLASFRDQFMNYCDENNLDAFLEPSRN